jgi:predicted small lipoprotein YifL
MLRGALLIASLAGLAACGVRAPLQPEPGESLPVAPETAASQPTAEELLRRPPIAAPARIDELLTRSEEREEDRFDLPPQ